MNKIILVCCFLFVKVCKAQTGGKKTYLFLNSSIFAHQNALGGKTVTLTDNINQPIMNPAITDDYLTKKIGISYTSYIAGISTGLISYAHKFNNKMNPFHFSITYFNYGYFIEADKNGNEIGTFNANDFALSIGYAFNITDTNFKVGSNIKLIYSNISDYNSTGIATDIAILYKKNNIPYVFTIIARNIGSQIKSYNGIKENIPFELLFGVSYQMEKVPLKWHLTLENLQQWEVAVPNPSERKIDLNNNITEQNIGFMDNLIRHLSLGAELFSDRAVNLRIGYNFRRGQELKLQNTRTLGGLAFGLGVKLNRFKLNYAYSKYHTATNSNVFSLIINLEKTK